MNEQTKSNKYCKNIVTTLIPLCTMKQASHNRFHLKKRKTKCINNKYMVKKKSIYLDFRMVDIQTVGWCRINITEGLIQPFRHSLNTASLDKKCSEEQINPNDSFHNPLLHTDATFVPLNIVSREGESLYFLFLS